MREIDPVKFGKLVAGKRAEKGLTQSQLSVALFEQPVNIGRISEIENGKRIPNAEWIAALASALSISDGEIEDCVGQAKPRGPKVPDVPSQDVGPVFRMPDGILEAAPPGERDPERDNEQRIEKLKPLLLEIADDALEVCGRSNAYSTITKLVSSYRTEIDKPTDEIDYTRLFQRGLRLNRLLNAGKRELSDRMLPEMEDDQKEALDSLLDLHGPFILSSHEGRELVALADRYERQPEQEREFQEAAREFAEEVSAVADEEAEAIIMEAAEGLSSPTEPERNQTFGLATVRNASTVLISGYLMGVAAKLAATSALPIGVPAAVFGLSLLEATKKSKAFQALSEPIRNFLDTLSEGDLKKLGGSLSKTYKSTGDFIKQKEPLLRKLAGSRREMSWLHKSLDFILKSKSIDPDVPDDPGPISRLPHKSVFREMDEIWCPEMLVIDPPEKTFMMGAPLGEQGSGDDERPVHEVTIKRKFALGRYTVTFDEYDAYCEAVGIAPPDDAGWGRGRRPVINVSWNDAQKYFAWLNAQLGLLEGTYRLPSEAEWEFACRAGTTTPFWTGATISMDQANYDGNYPYKNSPKGEYREQTVQVDEMPGAVNPWGLAHMHGNVWEWCVDPWHGHFEGAPDDGSIWRGDSAERVLRGGSWVDDAHFCRSASRYGHAADYRLSYIGFRPARTL